MGEVALGLTGFATWSRPASEENVAPDMNRDEHDQERKEQKVKATSTRALCLARLVIVATVLIVAASGLSACGVVVDSCVGVVGNPHRS
jgi:p-aminobenzoyl-glutamate transporter AbgT